MRRVLSRVGRCALGDVHRKLAASQEDPLTAQERAFRRLERSLRGTRIHQESGLARCRSYVEYAAEMPPRSFDFYAPYVREILGGGRDVLFRGRPRVFLKTSGSTDAPKHIPYGAEAVRALSRFQTRFLSSIVENDPSFPVFGNRLAFGNVCADAPVNGTSVNYVSGYLRSCTPFFLKRTIYPSLASLGVRDWGERVRAVLRETARRDIHTLTTMPMLGLSLLQDLVAAAGKRTIQDIWPSFGNFVYSGLPIAPYKAELERLSSRELRFIGSYIASECPIGFADGSGCGADGSMLLNLDDVLLTFSEPCRSEPGGAEPPRHVGELVEGREYQINIGYFNGLLQYQMRDVVRVASVAPRLRVDVVGRSDIVLDAAAERITDSQLNQAIERLGSRIGARIMHAIAYPTRTASGRFAHSWLVFSDDAALPAGPELAAAVDAQMRSASFFYSALRGSDILAAPVVRVVPTARLRRYQERSGGVGNFKPKKAFRTEREFDAFYDENLR